MQIALWVKGSRMRYLAHRRVVLGKPYLDRYVESFRHALLLECEFLCCLLLDSFFPVFDIL